MISPNLSTFHHFSEMAAIIIPLRLLMQTHTIGRVCSAAPERSVHQVLLNAQFLDGPFLELFSFNHEPYPCAPLQMGNLPE